MVSDQEFKKVQEDLKKVQDILFGIGDDVRFKAKIRKSVIDKTESGLPIITDTNGTRWSITNVTKLN